MSEQGVRACAGASVDVAMSVSAAALLTSFADMLKGSVLDTVDAFLGSEVP